jgi:hypothetical protein
MRLTVGPDPMKIESEKYLANGSLVDARLDGASIDGLVVTDLLASSRAGHGTKSA